MEPYKIARFPPLSIEFLRVVDGVEQAKILCQNCGAYDIYTWDELGLPDSTPFPPEGSVGKCHACGSDNVVAKPVWPEGVKQVSAERITPEPTPSAGDEFETAIRDQLESVLKNLGSTKFDR